MQQIALILPFLGYSQKQLNRELMIENDNDAYTLNLTRDQYYSNGVALRYRTLLNPEKWSENVTKQIISFDVNHRIYTPKRLWWEELEQLDRPYAGQLSASVSKEFYYKSQRYFKIKGELGWMGPAIQTGEIQYNWHKTFGMQLPLAWQFEIGNAPLINTYATYAFRLFGMESFELLSESNGALGTSFIHARQEIMVRVGLFKPINESTQFNGVTGNIHNGARNHEIYFFISPGIEYVPYNSTIEGHFWGESSIHTEDRVAWVGQTRIGVMASWTTFDFGLIYYRRTEETTEAVPHKYVGIRMNQRF
ncbi:MAG: lipid A deacylase LpxR family protein [Bacteroidota bacterium]